jgi:hypothetical protein
VCDNRRVRPRLLAASLSLLALTAAGCGGQDTASPLPAGATGSTGTPPASPSPSLSTAAVPPADPDEAGEPEEGAEFGTAPATAPGGGGGLSVVDVRVGEHEGYDRVVFELAGEGTVGWRVQYEDDPRTPGEGAPVELEGEAVLSVALEGVGYPFDTGIEEYAGPKRQSPRLSSIRELQLGAVYEGYYDAFVGVAERRSFRVFSLESPTRVVVDVSFGD